MIGTLVNNRTNEEHGLETVPTPLGRHQANALRLRGFAVSRFHAEIGETAPGQPYVEDMVDLRHLRQRQEGRRSHRAP